MNSSRTHTEIATFMASSFQCFGASTGSARKPSSARPMAIAETTALLTTTHTRTTAADSVWIRPAPVGRLSMARLNRLFAAPPVKTHP